MIIEVAEISNIREGSIRHGNKNLFSFRES